MQTPVEAPNTPVLPPVVTPPPANMPQQQPVSPPSSAFPPQVIVIGIAAVVFIILGVIGLTAFKPQKIVVTPTPTPSTPIATPTPARTLSPLATQSAFLLFEQSVASLSAGIAAYNVQDQSLTPPVLVLPLGFSQ